MIPAETIAWLLQSSEPWTRYRLRLDLLSQPGQDSQVRAERAALLTHPKVCALLREASAWPEPALTRHNDARHPIYKLATLAEFGLQADDPGVPAIAERILTGQSPHGALRSLVNIPAAFGGSGQDAMTWLACDAPTLLYILLKYGLGSEPAIQRALDHLLSLVGQDGWGCVAASELGRFKGPGRRGDPCPIANLYALKALSQVPDLTDSPAARSGAEMLLRHWAGQGQVKYFLFGVGSDYIKLKYPFIWYDLLHVADVLSGLPYARRDARYQDMLAAITCQADELGRYTAGSMYLAWKGWSFADKKLPSPWLTLVVHRILKTSAI